MSEDRKGTVIFYVSRKCPVCHRLMEQQALAEQLYVSEFGFEDIEFRYVEDDSEFMSFGFERVPTLILPKYRPFEAIEPEIALDKNYIKQMLKGIITVDDIIHDKEKKRREKGQVINENLEKLLGGV